MDKEIFNSGELNLQKKGANKQAKFSKTQNTVVKDLLDSSQTNQMAFLNKIGAYTTEELEKKSTNPTMEKSRLLEKRQQLFDAQEELKDKRQEFDKRLETIQDREGRMAGQRKKLTQNIMELDNFIRKNEIKKMGAEQQRTKEREARISAEKTNKELNSQLSNLEESLVEKEKIFKGYYIKYQQFLQEVVSYMGDSSEEVKSVIDRFDTLEKNKQDLEGKKDKLQRALQLEKENLKEFSEAKVNSIIHSNSRLSSLSTKSERQKYEKSQTAVVLKDNIYKHSENSVQLGNIKMAIVNMYERVMKESTISRGKKSTKQSKRDMLQTIGDCISDFSNVVGALEKEENQKKKEKEENEKEAKQ